jgi:hypothetical protein
MRKLLNGLSFLLPTIISFIILLGAYYTISKNIYWFGMKAAASQDTILRELTEIEQQKLFLLEHTNYETFKKLNVIFWCESKWKQSAYNPKTKDWGIIQANEATWDKVAQSLGLDYKNSWQDNLLLGIHILKVQGYAAWSWSVDCHHII